MPYPSKRVALICETCGQEFTVKKSEAVKRRYCSWACIQSARANLRAVTQCKQCGKTFTHYVNHPQNYCSISCGLTARNLTAANPAYQRDISGANNPMYGRGASGSANPMYGKRKPNVRKIRKDGYVLVRAPEGHPYPCDTSSGIHYILEHRLVMERALGRYLLPGEIVHHIDGNPSNNALDNLRLYATQSAHVHLAHGSSVDVPGAAS